MAWRGLYMSFSLAWAFGVWVFGRWQSRGTYGWGESVSGGMIPEREGVMIVLSSGWVE